MNCAAYKWKSRAWKVQFDRRRGFAVSLGYWTFAVWWDD